MKITSMKYVKQFNGGSISAIQLLPEEVSPSEEYLKELHDLLDDITWFSDRDGAIQITQYIGLTVDVFLVPPSHWIIRDDLGIISELSPGEFEKEYQ